jgi:molybdopterin molybdotransferase
MDQTIPMRSVEEAQRALLQHIRPLEVEEVALLESLGRTLAADIYADIDVPPFANSSMDGYAVLAADVAGAGEERPATLQIIAEIAAGRPSDQPLTPGTAARNMTGAPPCLA